MEEEVVWIRIHPRGPVDIVYLRILRVGDVEAVDVRVLRMWDMEAVDSIVLRMVFKGKAVKEVEEVANIVSITCWRSHWRL